MLERVKEEEEKKKRNEKRKKRKSNEREIQRGGCFPKQEDEEDGITIAPVESRVKSKVDALLCDDNGIPAFLLIFTFARAVSKSALPAKVPRINSCQNR